MEERMITELNLNPIIHEGQRCVTLAQVDRLHERDGSGAAKDAFRRRRDKFKEGKHFFRGVLNTPRKEGRGGHRGEVILLTEKGYCLLAKTFDDDRAWAIQEELVDSYFRTADSQKVLTPGEQFLAQAEALRESALKMLENERRISLHEAMIADLQSQMCEEKEEVARLEEQVIEGQGKIQQILDFQMEAAQECLTIPLAANPAAPITTKDRCNQTVRAYAQLKGLPYRSVWGEMYTQFYYRTRVCVNARKNWSREGMSMLEKIEELGMIEDLWLIISEKLGPAVNEAKLKVIA
jgi:hypothetical protein